MKRRRGEIQIFSLSAIDLFACAMAAFMVITVALIPHYGANNRPLRDAREAAAKANAEANKQKQAAEQEKRSREEAEEKLTSGTMSLMLRATAEPHELTTVPGLAEPNAGFAVLDVDLLVLQPDGELIWFGNRGSPDSGRLTVDSPISGGVNLFVAKTVKPGRYVIWANLQQVDERAKATYEIAFSIDATFPRRVENVSGTLKSNQINPTFDNNPPAQAGRLRVLEFDISPTNDVTVIYALGR